MSFGILIILMPLVPQLWLSLADKYLKSKNVDWAQQRDKCFCEEWREDDEELGIQIVKVRGN